MLAEDQLAMCLDRAGAHRNARFRRNARLGPYVVDFLCPEARLIVELDCTPLRTREAQATHRRRLRALEARGYRILRFWSDHVATAPDTVERVVRTALPAQSSHQRRLPTRPRFGTLPFGLRAA